MTARASAIHPPQRDAVGVAFVLLSGLGVVFLPTISRFAYLDRSNVNTVALARDLIAGIAQLFFVVLAAIFMFEKLPYSPA